MRRRYILSLILLLFFVGCVHKSPPRKPQAPKGIYHTVRRHETLWRICKTYGVDMDYVARINGIKDKSKIKVGQKIFIPGATRPLKVKVPIEDITSAKRPRKRSKSTASPSFIWPVKGRVTRGFYQGKGKRHDGIDIASELGTPVRAAASGRVVYSDNELAGYGNLIIIEHPGGYYTIYAHNLVNLVEEEVWVEKGQIIAKVGRSGNATSPILHFEIRKGSKPLNPLKFLP